MHKVLGDRKAIAILLGPALLLYTLIIIVPVVWSLGLSFFEGNAFAGFTFVGLDNINRLIADQRVHQALWFTIRFGVVVTLAQVLTGYLLSLFYVFILKKASALIRTLVFFPVIIPTVAVGLMFRQFFEYAPRTGPINVFIQWAGGGAIDWFADGGTAFWVIIAMEVWRSMGFYAVLLYAGLMDIPEETLESARLDGASGFRLLRHIVFPLSLPVLFSALIFSINGTLKIFDTVVALTNGGPGRQTTPLTLLMFRTSFAYGQYGYGASIAMLLTILCLIVTLVIFRGQRRDLTKA